MRTLLSVLPLAFVMIAGPQIISAVFLATSLDWRRSSAAFLAGALSSITIVVSAAYVLTRAAKGGDSSSASGTTGHVIDSVVLVLLLVLAFTSSTAGRSPSPRSGWESCRARPRASP